MNHRNRKKGQAMLFIVLALVLVFVFILIFSIISQDKEDIIPKGEETEVNIALNTIEGCVSRKISEELLDLGKRGLQNGFDVPITMKRPSEIVFNSENRYSPFVCNGKIYPFEDHSLILKDGCENKEAYLIYYDNNFNQKSLDSNFEKSIQNKLDECYSFQNEVYGFEVNPVSEPSIDAKFGKNELIVDVERVVQIDFNDGSSSKIHSKVRETMDVRIGDLINFAGSVIAYDSTNLTFSPVAYSSNGFRVEIHKDYTFEGGKKGDVLKFIDDKSRVNGQKFELHIGRENVWPIISFIPDEIYINLSNSSQYLPESDFLDNFIGNCSEGNTEEAQSNLISYLYTQIKFYDRDEDSLEVSTGTNLQCPMSAGYFNFELNLTDGAFNESSKILFRVFEDDVNDE